MKSFSAIQDLGPWFWRSAIMKSFRAVTVFFLMVFEVQVLSLRSGSIP